MKNYDRNKVIELWNLGKTSSQIAKELDVSERTIIAYIATHRDKCPKRRERCTYEYDPNKLIELYKKEMTCKQISEELGIPETFVDRFLKNHFTLRKKQKKNRYDEELLVQLWNEGKSYYEIAKRLGIAESTVSNYVTRNRNKCPKRRECSGYVYDKEMLIEMWNADKTVEQIAEALNISIATVKNYIATHRDVCKKKFERFSYDEDKLVELWNSTLSTQEIADQLHIPRQVVVNYAANHRDKCPKKVANYDKESIIRMWNEGYTARKIAEELGIDKATVGAFVSNHRELCPKHYK